MRPAIIQDALTNKVLMLGYMTEEAMQQTKATNKVTFFSRSKQRLWTKGETSGNFLLVKEIQVDCDADTILIKAIPTGPVCHTGADTCFQESNKEFTLQKLEAIIADRKKNPVAGSYTTSLFEKGINKIAQKFGEEAVELVIESKDDNEEKLVNEAADLLYHFMVLLQAKDILWKDVLGKLSERHIKTNPTG